MPIRKASDEYYDEPDDQTEPTEAGSGEGETAVGLLPKSILMGKDVSVGDELVLKITGINDDQIQVAYPEEEDTEASDEAVEEMPSDVPEGESEATVAESVGDDRYE